MSSRPTARCTRAVQQLRAPTEAIWITDGLLTSAFERYCHVSHLARRNSSSTPGPLESRKRLGKRKMTAMYLDHQSTLPPWAMEFPVDLSKWKWQPPTLRQSSGDNDLHVEKDRPAPAESTTPWMVIQKMMGTFAGEEKAQEDDGRETIPADPLMERLSQARSAVAASTRQAMDPAFWSFTRHLEQDIKSGALDSDAVVMAVSTFPQSLANAEADRRVVRTAIGEFLSAVVSGIKSSSRCGAADFKDTFWNQVLIQTSQLREGSTKLSLFQTILDAIPLSYIDDVHEGVVAAVQSLVARGKWRTRAADIGVALRRLSPEDHNALLGKLETAIHESLRKTQKQTLQLLWLQILAHMPLVGQDYLLDACVRSAYFDRCLLGSAGRDLSELLYDQWTSRGYLQYHGPEVAEWKRVSGGRPELSLAALVVKIGYNTPVDYIAKGVWILLSLLKFLRRFGRQEDLFDSMRAFCQVATRLPIVPFSLLAKAAGDHRFALTTLSMLENRADQLDGKKRQWWQWLPQSKRDHQILKQWDWKAWPRYVEGMIKDESINPAVVWKVVRSGAVADFRWKTDWRRVDTRKNVERQLPYKRRLAEAERWRKTRIELIQNMAVWFSEAEHLTDSIILRNVGRCVTWLRAHEVELERRVVLAVVTVGLRELKRCEPGRTRRISWVLDIIEEHGGEKERRLVARRLQRWREANVASGARAEEAKSG
ncbi:hypothetical protein GCG54_00004183 [Colletotrichum gloeosporioides]|uniref:Uncharacterized protein n=1 Tax=Colletotrichum gloeosporioides TaxID=474922 RepID=A0A8H4CJ41_COLGL|nr:uncharacterized protein GCG54_00004183 [Colletotrichum gloeosporioides]KAF3804913.1 hypothetical protein GCG54_00004183 [Colletotrichum gloeosporioides]